MGENGFGHPYNCWTLYMCGSLVIAVRTLVGRKTRCFFWRMSAFTTKPSDVRRNRLHSSFAPKQSVCKMNESAARDKCAGGLTPGLTRNHSSQGLVSQSRIRATVTRRHQGVLALRSPQGLSCGEGDNTFSNSSLPIKHFVIGKKPKNVRKN